MIQDNTTKWKVRKFTDFASNQAMPVGYVHWSISPIVPAGELPLLGGTYDRSLYADLWSWANENGLVISESEWQANVLESGKCDKFSDGNGSTTFRVPKLPTTIASDVPSEVPVVGNGMTLGVTDGSGNYGLRASGGANGEYLTAGSSLYGQNVGSESDDSGVQDLSLGVTTDPTKSGIVAQTSSTKITGQWLIVAFGVAHNVGNADIAEVMQAVEQVQTGLGTLEQGVGTAIDYIIESYRNGTEWYEVYKSGKVRQGGVSTISGDNKQVTLLKAMQDTAYKCFITTFRTSGTAAPEYSPIILKQSNTKTAIYVTLGGTPKGLFWEVEGQGA